MLSTSFALSPSLAMSCANLPVSPEEASDFADGIRRELYAPISAEESEEGADEFLARLRRASRTIEVEWVHLPGTAGLEGDQPADGDPTGGNLLGRTIGELGVRSETGASVLAVVRGEDVIPNPGAHLRLEPGDAVGILGKPEQRAAFRALARESTQGNATL